MKYVGVGVTIEERMQDLRNRLEAGKNRENRIAHRNHFLAVLAMALMLGASALAGVGGIFFGLDSRATGALALIPGVVSVMATAVKFDVRANYHRRKRISLDALLRRLLYELPEHPTADDLGTISSEWTAIEKATQKEYEKIAFDWRIFRRP